MYDIALRKISILNILTIMYDHVTGWKMATAENRQFV